MEPATVPDLGGWSIGINYYMARHFAGESLVAVPPHTRRQFLISEARNLTVDLGEWILDPMDGRC